MGRNFLCTVPNGPKFMVIESCSVLEILKKIDDPDILVMYCTFFTECRFAIML